MSRVMIPEKEAEYSQWLIEFANSAAEFADELGFTTEEVAAFAESAAKYREALLASERAKTAAASAVAAKNSERAASEQLFRSAARRVNADANIQIAVKAQLGISATAKHYGQVVTPENLVLTCVVEGLNKLVWKPTTNAPGTQYVIEAKKPSEPAWSMIGVCTAHKFVHRGQKPGVTISYRVNAVRAGKSSPPTVAVTAYPHSEVEPIVMKPAA